MKSTRKINELRPSSKIQKSSNLTKKPAVIPISTTSSTVISGSSIPSASYSEPVIIQAHSPMVIHVQACDFKAVVQKLTGFIPSNDDNNTNLILNKKKKINVGSRREKLVESSLNDNGQLQPQQWPSVTPTANVGFKPLPNTTGFKQAYTSENFQLPNST